MRYLEFVNASKALDIIPLNIVGDMKVLLSTMYGLIVVISLVLPDLVVCVLARS